MLKKDYCAKGDVARPSPHLQPTRSGILASQLFIASQLFFASQLWPRFRGVLLLYQGFAPTYMRSPFDKYTKPVWKALDCRWLSWRLLHHTRAAWTTRLSCFGDKSCPSMRSAQSGSRWGSSESESESDQRTRVVNWWDLFYVSM